MVFFNFSLFYKGRVGKTSLALKYIKNEFNQQEKTTTQADYLEKNVEIAFGEYIKLEI